MITGTIQLSKEDNISPFSKEHSCDLSNGYVFYAMQAKNDYLFLVAHYWFAADGHEQIFYTYISELNKSIGDTIEFIDKEGHQYCIAVEWK